VIEIGNVVYQQISIGSGFINHWYLVESVEPPRLRCLGVNSSNLSEITDPFRTAGKIFKVRNFEGFVKPS